MVKISEVRAQQPEWFSAKNKRFFGDVGYKVLQGKKTKKPYLIRSTYAWSDMFGQQRTLHYRVNPINADTLKIESLIDKRFTDLESVKWWLEDN